MSSWSYYNEIDEYAAAWLRNLIRAGHIAPGEVDTRSIEDVHPEDLRGFAQCHFFAGIGIWSLALRKAGWPDSRPVWTGSCPCQPFSAAGAGAGFDDERHLWPHFHWLIQECRPPTILGEQVASRDAGPWIDLVANDMEGLGLAFGAVAFPASGIGSMHLRDRTYWCAYANEHSCGRKAPAANHQRAKANGPTNRTCGHCRLPDRAGPTVDWVVCADGKSRPTQPGVCVLADEYPGRVDQLRAFGNAIDAQAAETFIRCVMPSLP